MRKVLRYHRDVYFPDWSVEAIQEFLKTLRKNGGLSVSIHSVEKIVNYCFQYGRQMLKYLLKSVRKSTFDVNSIFEFYAIDRRITKACLRFSFTEFPVDLVLVISADGNIITIFTTHKGDNHDTMNTELYERS